MTWILLCVGYVREGRFWWPICATGTGVDL